MDQEKMHSMEGQKGLQNLCQIAGALGYKDSMYFGQLTSKACVGDLLEMLRDNSGMIEAMLEWIQSRNFSEFREPLEALLPEVNAVKAAYPGGECPDCGEDIPDDVVAGADCSNCGHVFHP
jgi:hypothetical protein